MIDVLVLGEHPAAYLAAALLRAKPALRVTHATLPQKQLPDRLVLINPEFFSLHPLLGPLRRKLEMTAIYGLKFLADDPTTVSEHRGKATMGLVMPYQQLCKAMAKIAEESGAELETPDEVTILHLDESGVDATLDGKKIRATALIVADILPPAQAKLIGVEESWDSEIVHQYCFAKLPRGCKVQLTERPVLPMSLDLKRSLCWAWLLPHENSGQLCAMQQREGGSHHDPAELLRHWLGVLRAHGIVTGGAADWNGQPHTTVDLPLAGALAGEGVANRTLLIGPGGGFYSACAEDIYPNCWSALFAVETIRGAAKEKHFQDALNPYRHNWRTTLGDYLRGPQQNLRFLLPLIYRNQKMCSRLAEAILLGKHMVR